MYLDIVMMTYKGYTASIEVDVDAGILFGRILDIKDVITFKARTIDEARQEFQNSVDEYLAFCEELGEEPDKPFLENFPFELRQKIIGEFLLLLKKLVKVLTVGWMRF